LVLDFIDDEPLWVLKADDAKTLAIKFVNRHGAEQMDLEDELQATWSKLEAVCFRLAMLFSLIRWAESDDPSTEIYSVCLEDMRQAIELTEWFCNEWKRFFASFGETSKQSEQRKLVEWIMNKRGAVTARAVSRGPRRYRGDIAKAELALRDLVKAGLCRSYINEHQGGRGRPVEIFELLGGGDGYTNS
jgi:hypothetical protein